MVQQSTVYVREVTLDDLKHNEVVAGVVNSAYRTKGGWTTEEHLVTGDRASATDIEDAVINNGKPNILLYAFDSSNQDTVIGTVQIQPESEDSKVAEIGMFSVAPTFQSRGVGGSLMRAAFARMKEAGFTTATLHVLESRPELEAWYRKLGFKETGEKLPFIWTEKLKAQGLMFSVFKKEL